MSSMLRKICPAGSGVAGYWRAGWPLAQPLLPTYVRRFPLIWGVTPPSWPARALNSRLDIVACMDIIIFTMIRRSPKPNPKLRALRESGTANPHAHAGQDPACVDSEFFDP